MANKTIPTIQIKDSNVGIGTTSPTQLLHIVGTNAENNGVTIQNTNSSGNSQVRFLNTSGNQRAAITYVNSYDAVFHWTSAGGNVLNLVGANVGIGTTSPATKLVVENGGFAVQGASSWPTSGSGLEFWNAGTTSYIGAFNRTTSAYRDMFLFANDTIFENGGSERMRITSGGNVGIGTTSPTGKLEIAGATELLRLQTTYPIGSARGIISWYDTTDVTGRIYTIYDGTTVDMRIGALYSSGYNTSDLVTIKGNGNVGIGTTNPTTALVIQGGGAFSAAVTIQHTAASGYSGIDFFENTGTLVGSLWHANSSGVASNQNAMTLSARNAGDKVYIVAGGYDPSTSGGITVAAGNVGIGTTSPVYRLHVDGGASGIPLFVKGGTSGWAIFERNNKQLYINANYSDLNLYAQVSPAAVSNMGLSLSARETVQDLYLTTSGNVGIGTTSPSAKLHVTGELKLTGAAAAYTFFDQINGTYYSVWYRNNNITYLYDSYLNSNPFVINSSGNVGIGTTSPGYKLEVVGSIWAIDYFIQNSVGTGGTFRLDAYQDYLYIYGDSSAIAGYRFGSDIVGTVMQIGTNGNVGIGTTSPNRNLTVSGNGTLLGLQSNTAGGYSEIEMTANGTSGGYIFKLSAGNSSYAGAGSLNIYNSNSIGFHTAAVTNAMFIASANGNVGIGTTSPAQKLSVFGNIYQRTGDFITWNNGDAQIGAVSGYNLAFSTYNGSSAMLERMRITSDGNVGINTTTPTAKLDVDGTVNATNFSAAGAFGWTGIVTFPGNPPGMQNIQFQGGIVINVF